MVSAIDLEAAEPRARGFKALGDPTRLRIMAVLVGGKRCECEILEIVAVPANLLSHHLKVLRGAGLIAGKRREHRFDDRLDSGVLGARAAPNPTQPEASLAAT